jgi:hypothetical protein
MAGSVFQNKNILAIRLIVSISFWVSALEAADTTPIFTIRNNDSI